MGDEGEADALHCLGVETTALRRFSQRRTDAQAIPQLIEHEGTTQAPRINDLHFGTRGRGRRVTEHSADGGHQTSEGRLVHLGGTSEVVDDLGDWDTRDRVTFVVGELQVGDLRAVLVAATGLPNRQARVRHPLRISISNGRDK